MSTLARFTDPASVAVVGASADPAKWGHWLALGALAGAHRRRVHLVNHRGGLVAGRECLTSVRALPEVPELVAVCVPARAVSEVVEEALALGVRAFLVITSGFTPAAEAALADRVRRAGARLIGPSCLGLYDADTELRLLWGECAPGALAIVSQSGQLGLEVAGLAAAAGLGVSRFVSVGAQCDVTATDLLHGLAGHARTRVVLLYLEGFGDGRAVHTALARLRAAGKPVVVLTAGASPVGAAAVRSHTGALSSTTDVVRAALRAAVAILARTPAEAVRAAAQLAAGIPRGDRVGVVSDSGGQGALAADLISEAGLTPGIPVDLAGAGEGDLGSYAVAIERVLGGGDVDAVLLTGYFGRYAVDSPGQAAAEIAVARRLAELGRGGCPLVVHSMAAHEPDSPAVAVLRAGGVTVHAEIDMAVEALSLAAQWRAGAARDLSVRGVDARAVGHGTQSTTATVNTSWSDSAPSVITYWSARELLSASGVPYPAAQPVASRTEVLAATARLRGPFVLKAGWIEHRTEQDAVRVGLADPVAVLAGYDELAGRLGEHGYVVEVQDQRAGVVELIVGFRRDPAFGPVVLVGIGGTLAEVYRDVTVELAPVDADLAGTMLRRLRGWPLLAGWRGRPAVDVEAAARVVAAVSRVALTRGDLAEGEINPLRVGPSEAVAVDALLVPMAGRDQQAAEARADVAGVAEARMDLAGAVEAQMDVTGAAEAQMDDAQADTAGVDTAGADSARPDVVGLDVTGLDLTGADVAGADVTGTSWRGERMPGVSW
ncbi:acetate--CoA ligase family protein [Crossiella cryophila]|uniref:acetate--CoA ligase family protein n=1 Tax=Crossiella cryophila TaxID=43355 RepID=UPI0031E7381F